VALTDERIENLAQTQSALFYLLQLKAAGEERFDPKARAKL
jgi:hypothetical protein